MKLALEKIVGDEPGPHLLITGGVHGDEFEPMAAIRRLIGPLRAGRICGRVTLVPVVNEPAFVPRNVKTIYQESNSHRGMNSARGYCVNGMAMNINRK